jgi:hypothetical protein
MHEIRPGGAGPSHSHLPRTPFLDSFDPSASPEVEQVRRVSVFSVPVRFFPRRDILVVGCRGALKGRLRVRAKGQAHRYSCLIETALHRRAACLRTTGFSMEDV